jgi:uncharacterized protein YukE
MALEGLDPEVVTQLAGQLKAQSQSIGGVIAHVDGIVNRIDQSWHGHTASEFAGWWRQQHRPALVDAQNAVDSLHQSALNNVAQQEQASGDDLVGFASGELVVGIGGALLGAASATWYVDRVTDGVGGIAKGVERAGARLAADGTTLKSEGGSELRQGGEIGREGHQLMEDGRDRVARATNLADLSKDGSALDKVFEGARVLGAGAAVVGGLADAWNYFSSDTHDSMTQRVAKGAIVGSASAAGGWAGAWGGAEGGAAVGAMVGSIFPGAGTVVGGVAGGLIGGVAGGLAGSWAGKWIGGGVASVEGNVVGNWNNDVAQPVTSFVHSALSWF